MTETIFRLQMTMGLVFWGLVAWTYILPKLYGVPFHRALLLPLLIAVLRFHGTNFLVPEANAGLAEAFAKPAGWGDFTVCLIAIAAVVLCQLGSKAGPMVAWLYGIAGTLDFAMGFYLGEVNDMPHHLGATWFMVTQEAPLQIVAIFVLFRLLLKHPQRAAAVAPA
jgi:hypothetical protein